MKGNVFSQAELDLLRSDTPALGRYAHFNHGSASLPPAPVFAAQRSWIDTESRVGSHRAAEHHAAALADVRASVARLLNAKAHQIALLDSASRSWSTAMSAALNGGRPLHVITTDLEYGANAIYLLLAAERDGLSFSVMPVRPSADSLPQLVAKALEAIPRHVTPVVSLSVVSVAWGIESVTSAIGQEISRLVRERDGFLFLDASHAVGQVPIDVEALGCDVLVFPARKWLRGPKGVGVLCLSDRALERFGAADSTDAAAARWSGKLEVQPHYDARRFEGYEFNPGLHLSLKAACDYAVAAGLDRIAAQNRKLRVTIEAALASRLGWTPTEADGGNATALMTYRMPETRANLSVYDVLWEAGVNIAEITSQHAFWALESIGAKHLLRVTPHYMTGDSEIGRLADALADVFAT